MTRGALAITALMGLVAGMGVQMPTMEEVVRESEPEDEGPFDPLAISFEDEVRQRADAALAKAEEKRFSKRMKALANTYGIKLAKCSLEEKVGLLRYVQGEKPVFSTNIADELTCGYGKLGECGDWEFPLPCFEKLHPITHKQEVSDVANAVASYYPLQGEGRSA